MVGETKNQFSLTGAALSTSGRAKSKFLSVTNVVINFADSNNACLDKYFYRAAALP